MKLNKMLANNRNRIRCFLDISMGILAFNLIHYDFVSCLHLFLYQIVAWGKGKSNALFLLVELSVFVEFDVIV
jgi:hypothetical protein